LRLEDQTLAEVPFIPVRTQPDALLGVCQRLAELAEVQERGAAVAAGDTMRERKKEERGCEREKDWWAM
jgi:hypothetical protein